MAGNKEVTDRDESGNARPLLSDLFAPPPEGMRKHRRVLLVDVLANGRKKEVVKDTAEERHAD